jgi:hypothetical protein
MAQRWLFSLVLVECEGQWEDRLAQEPAGPNLKDNNLQIIVQTYLIIWMTPQMTYESIWDRVSIKNVLIDYIELELIVLFAAVHYIGHSSNVGEIDGLSRKFHLTVNATGTS